MWQSQDRLASVCHFESLKGFIWLHAPFLRSFDSSVSRPADNTLFISLPLVKVSVYV
jgi:hypothetical protein